ncbi:MAG: elongation factor P [Planctomycetes bacterium]|nr:elongation factor P [Planctomycetota bacterium]
MAVKATDLRKGTVIIGDHGKLLLITEYHHHTPGNLRAVIHLKVRDVMTGVVTPMRLSSSDSFEVAYLDKRKCEYLYKEQNGNYVFMDQTTYEQIPLSPDLVADKMGFVRENTAVDVTFHETTPLGIELPPSVTLKVIEAEHAVKGNTATNVKKEAVVETGMTVKVPLHVVAGDEIKISTADGEFQGRANG